MGKDRLTKYEKMLDEAKPYDLFVRYRAEPELLWDAMNIKERKEYDNDMDAFCSEYRKRAAWMMALAFGAGIVVAVLIGFLSNLFFNAI